MLSWFAKTAPIRLKFDVLTAVYGAIGAVGLIATIAAQGSFSFSLPVIAAAVALVLSLGAMRVARKLICDPYVSSVVTMEHLAAKTLDLNAIGVATLATDRRLVFEAYADNRALGGFILIDKLTNATVAAGMLHFALRRAQNVHWQAVDISREAHARQKGQAPKLLSTAEQKPASVAE